jgi:hypothetical protein
MYVDRGGKMGVCCGVVGGIEMLVLFSRRWRMWTGGLGDVGC